MPLLNTADQVLVGRDLATAVYSGRDLVWTPDPAVQLLAAATLWLDATMSGSGQTIRNLGTGGAALDAQSGSTSGADTNDPKWLDWDGTNYCYLPGVAGNYLSVPDEAALDITGDIDIRVQVALDDSTPAGQMTLIGKDGGSGQYGYRLDLRTDGLLRFYWGTDATTLVSATASVATGVTDGAAKWIRVTRNATTGDVKFYLSDDNATYAQLGTTVTSTPSAMNANTTALLVGQNLTVQPLAGKVYRAVVKSGIDGTTVLDVDTSVISSGAATSFPALTGQTVSINRSSSGRKAVAVTSPCWLFGTDDYMEVADSDLLDFGAGDPLTMLAVARIWNAPAPYMTIIAKQTNVGPTQVGYQILMGATDVGVLMSDGTNRSYNPPAQTYTGAVKTYAGVRNVVTDTAETWVNGTRIGSTNDVTGSLVNSQVLRIGRLSGSGVYYTDMELLAVAVWRRALTAAELALMSDYFQARWS